MKKLVAIITIAVMLFPGFAFASDKEKIDARIKAAFLNDFSTARAVSWEKVQRFYVVKFTVNSIELNAAYNEDAELVATSRELASSLLPVSISLALGKKYDGYTISPKALELTSEGETSYYLSVENDRQLLKLKCSPGGYLTVEKKIKKT